jgi:histidinol-phosphate aminotransferase
MISGGVAALGWSALSSGVPVHALQQAAREGARQGAAAGPPLLYRLSSNENNYGLAPAAFEGLKSGRSYANRYGGESTGQLTEALAKVHGVPRDHILIAPGSGEILRAVTLAFTSPGKGLVTAGPSFEAPVRTAKSVNAAVQEVPVTAAGSLDLAAMAAASGPTTGLAFVCNPNNPTGGINPDVAVRDFVARFRKSSPDGYVLVDEAYADYVTDSSYASAVPLVLADPHVVVSRTFSKIHGMAGLRVGYAIGQPETLHLIRVRSSSGTLSSVSAGAALASLQDTANLEKQKEFNRVARAYTRQAFEKAGFTVLPSEGNFVMVDVKRAATDFQKMCREVGVAVARPFPPMTNYSRITIGTVDEMKKAVALMLPILATPPKTAPASSGVGLVVEDDEYGC